MCEALKGDDGGHGGGGLKGLVNVRGTFTASSGRPRRRSRWGWTPHPTPPPAKSIGPPERRPYAFETPVAGSSASISPVGELEPAHACRVHARNARTATSGALATIFSKATAGPVGLR